MGATDIIYMNNKSNKQQQSVHHYSFAATTESLHCTQQSTIQNALACTAERERRDIANAASFIAMVRGTEHQIRCVPARAHCSSSSAPSSSSKSSSSAVASWYCWYSETRSFILLSASVNSISSIPSPVYQCRKALRRNIAVNCSATRLNISWIAVVFPMKVADILSPRGGISQTDDLMLFGIHSTKYE